MKRSNIIFLFVLVLNICFFWGVYSILDDINALNATLLLALWFTYSIVGASYLDLSMRNEVEFILFRVVKLSLLYFLALLSGLILLIYLCLMGAYLR